MPVTRTDRSRIAQWWWTIDRVSLGAVLALMGIGVFVAFWASPAVATKKDFGDLHFVLRQSVFLLPAVLLFLWISFQDVRQIRRIAGIVFLASIALTIFAILFGDERNGATRWIDLGFFSLQPSEFLKPSFVVVAAWAFAEKNKRGDWPGYAIATGLFGLVLALLVLQPDYGQAALISAVWAGLFFLAGMPVIAMASLACLGSVGAVAAYLGSDHVRRRVDIFLGTGSGDSHQIDMSLAAFRAGGLTGQGPGEGAIKHHLPDSHTDFVFAVIGEEMGLIVCLVILVLFLTLVIRGFLRTLREDDHFVQLAASGLLLLFGTQAFINMAVSIKLIPAKGMTLPFISYGGSSLLAMALTMGMALALTRRRARIMPPSAARAWSFLR